MQPDDQLLPDVGSRDPARGTAIANALRASGQAPAEAVLAVQRLGLASLAGGSAITAKGIAQGSGHSLDSIISAIAELDSSGRIETDGEVVVGVAGLTQSTTSHKLQLPNATMHTWCALDAIGIPAAMELDAKLTTSCPSCGSRIAVAIKAGVPTADMDLRLFFPTAPCENVRADFCPSTNLFCSGDHLSSWSDAHPELAGDELDLAATTEIGRALWIDRV